MSLHDYEYVELVYVTAPEWPFEGSPEETIPKANKLTPERAEWVFCNDTEPGYILIQRVDGGSEGDG